jgi:AcrR family transcriptional regulator
MSPPKRAPESAAALRASLVDHARRLIAREGAPALTMRALATEAGCAVGLPYKVFADRNDLVVEICAAEFARLRDAYDQLVARAGTVTVGANLTWFAELLLGSPAVALTQEIFADETLATTIAVRIHESGTGPETFETVLAGYLAAEKRAGRVEPHIDENAFAFVLAGAVHNLVVSGAAWPKPSHDELEHRLTAIANAIAPRP